MKINEIKKVNAFDQNFKDVQMMVSGYHQKQKNLRLRVKRNEKSSKKTF